MPWDEPDTEYEIEDEARYEPQQDPVSAGIGARGFLAGHELDECVEHFPNSNLSRDPERFDRLYWEPELLLVDIVEDGTPEQLQRSRERKRVAFKEEWCREHGRRYLVLGETEAQDAQRVRELVHGSRQEPAAEKAPQSSRRKGGIERPKAAAQA